MKEPEHPTQPIVLDEYGTTRFKANKVVRFLYDWATQRGMGLNTLALMDFTDEDREQFAQLLGYSVSGFGELPYARAKTVAQVDIEAARVLDMRKAQKRKRR